MQSNVKLKGESGIRLQTGCVQLKVRFIFGFCVELRLMNGHEDGDLMEINKQTHAVLFNDIVLNYVFSHITGTKVGFKSIRVFLASK